MLLPVSVEYACLYTSSSSFDLIFDFGESHRLTPCKDSFVAYNLGDCGIVHLGNNHFCSTARVGDVQIKIKNGQGLKQFRHVPKKRMRLICVEWLDDERRLEN